MVTLPKVNLPLSTSIVGIIYTDDVGMVKGSL
jgi:hypothetical protein